MFSEDFDDHKWKLCPNCSAPNVAGLTNQCGLCNSHLEQVDFSEDIDNNSGLVFPVDFEDFENDRSGVNIHGDHLDRRHSYWLSRQPQSSSGVNQLFKALERWRNRSCWQRSSLNVGFRHWKQRIQAYQAIEKERKRCTAYKRDAQKQKKKTLLQLKAVNALMHVLLKNETRCKLLNKVRFFSVLKQNKETFLRLKLRCLALQQIDRRICKREIRMRFNDWKRTTSSMHILRKFIEKGNARIEQNRTKTLQGRYNTWRYNAAQISISLLKLKESNRTDMHASIKRTLLRVFHAQDRQLSTIAFQSFRKETQIAKFQRRVSDVMLQLHGLRNLNRSFSNWKIYVFQRKKSIRKRHYLNLILERNASKMQLLRIFMVWKERNRNAQNMRSTLYKALSMLKKSRMKEYFSSWRILSQTQTSFILKVRPAFEKYAKLTVLRSFNKWKNQIRHLRHSERIHRQLSVFLKFTNSSFTRKIKAQAWKKIHDHMLHVRYLKLISSRNKKNNIDMKRNAICLLTRGINTTKKFQVQRSFFIWKSKLHSANIQQYFQRKLTMQVLTKMYLREIRYGFGCIRKASIEREAKKKCIYRILKVQDSHLRWTMTTWKYNVDILYTERASRKSLARICLRKWKGRIHSSFEQWKMYSKWQNIRLKLFHSLLLRTTQRLELCQLRQGWIALLNSNRISVHQQLLLRSMSRNLARRTRIMWYRKWVKQCREINETERKLQKLVNILAKTNKQYYFACLYRACNQKGMNELRALNTQRVVLERCFSSWDRKLCLSFLIWKHSIPQERNGSTLVELKSQCTSLLIAKYFQRFREKTSFLRQKRTVCMRKVILRIQKKILHRAFSNFRLLHQSIRAEKQLTLIIRKWKNRHILCGFRRIFEFSMLKYTSKIALENKKLLIRRIAVKWSNTQMQRGFNTWKLYLKFLNEDVRAKRLKIKASKFRARILYKSTLSVFQVWKTDVEKRKHISRKLRIFFLKVSSIDVYRGFSKWKYSVLTQLLHSAKFENKLRVLFKISRRHGRERQRAALKLWNTYVVQEKYKCQKIKTSVLKLIRRNLSSNFQAWRGIYLTKKRQRYVLGKFLGKNASRLKGLVLSEWRKFTRRQQRLRKFECDLIKRKEIQYTFTAFESMYKFKENRKLARRMLKKMLVFVQNRSYFIAFSQLKRNTKNTLEKQVHTLKASIVFITLQKMYSKTLVGAFRRWNSYSKDQAYLNERLKYTNHIVRRFIFVNGKNSVSFSFGFWKSYVEGIKRKKKLLRRTCIRFKNRYLLIGFQHWDSYTRYCDKIDSLQKKLKIRSNQRLLAQYFYHFYEFKHQQNKFKAIVKRVVFRIKNTKLSMGFTKWCIYSAKLGTAKSCEEDAILRIKMSERKHLLIKVLQQTMYWQKFNAIRSWKQIVNRKVLILQAIGQAELRTKHHVVDTWIAYIGTRYAAKKAFRKFLGIRCKLLKRCAFNNIKLHSIKKKAISRLLCQANYNTDRMRTIKAFIILKKHSAYSRKLLKALRLCSVGLKRKGLETLRKNMHSYRCLQYKMYVLCSCARKLKQRSLINAFHLWSNRAKFRKLGMSKLSKTLIKVVGIHSKRRGFASICSHSNLQGKLSAFCVQINKVKYKRARLAMLRSFLYLKYYKQRCKILDKTKREKLFAVMNSPFSRHQNTRLTRGFFCLKQNYYLKKIQSLRNMEESRHLEKSNQYLSLYINGELETEKHKLMHYSFFQLKYHAMVNRQIRLREMVYMDSLKMESNSKEEYKSMNVVLKVFYRWRYLSANSKFSSKLLEVKRVNHFRRNTWVSKTSIYCSERLKSILKLNVFNAWKIILCKRKIEFHYNNEAQAQFMMTLMKTNTERKLKMLTTMQSWKVYVYEAKIRTLKSLSLYMKAETIKKRTEAELKRIFFECLKSKYTHRAKLQQKENHSRVLVKRAYFRVWKLNIQRLKLISKNLAKQKNEMIAKVFSKWALFHQLASNEKVFRKQILTYKRANLKAMHFRQWKNHHNRKSFAKIRLKYLLLKQVRTCLTIGFSKFKNAAIVDLKQEVTSATILFKIERSRWPLKSVCFNAWKRLKNSSVLVISLARRNLYQNSESHLLLYKILEMDKKLLICVLLLKHKERNAIKLSIMKWKQLNRLKSIERVKRCLTTQINKFENGGMRKGFMLWSLYIKTYKLVPRLGKIIVHFHCRFALNQLVDNCRLQKSISKCIIQWKNNRTAKIIHVWSSFVRNQKILRKAIRNLQRQIVRVNLSRLRKGCTYKKICSRILSHWHSRRLRRAFTSWRLENKKMASMMNITLKWKGRFVLGFLNKWKDTVKVRKKIRACIVRLKNKQLSASFFSWSASVSEKKRILTRIQQLFIYRAKFFLSYSAISRWKEYAQYSQFSECLLTIVEKRKSRDCFDTWKKVSGVKKSAILLLQRWDQRKLVVAFEEWKNWHILNNAIEILFGKQNDRIVREGFREWRRVIKRNNKMKLFVKKWKSHQKWKTFDKWVRVFLSAKKCRTIFRKWEMRQIRYAVNKWKNVGTFARISEKMLRVHKKHLKLNSFTKWQTTCVKMRICNKILLKWRKREVLRSFHQWQHFIWNNVQQEHLQYKIHNARKNIIRRWKVNRIRIAFIKWKQEDKANVIGLKFFRKWKKHRLLSAIRKWKRETRASSVGTKLIRRWKNKKTREAFRKLQQNARDSSIVEKLMRRCFLYKCYAAFSAWRDFEVSQNALEKLFASRRKVLVFIAFQELRAHSTQSKACVKILRRLHCYKARKSLAIWKNWVIGHQHGEKFMRKWKKHQLQQGFNSWISFLTFQDRLRDIFRKSQKQGIKSLFSKWKAISRRSKKMRIGILRMKHLQLNYSFQTWVNVKTRNRRARQLFMRIQKRKEYRAFNKWVSLCDNSDIINRLRKKLLNRRETISIRFAFAQWSSVSKAMFVTHKLVRKWRKYSLLQSFTRLKTHCFNCRAAIKILDGWMNRKTLFAFRTWRRVVHIRNICIKSKLHSAFSCIRECGYKSKAIRTFNKKVTLYQKRIAIAKWRQWHCCLNVLRILILKADRANKQRSFNQWYLNLRRINERERELRDKTLSITLFSKTVSRMLMKYQVRKRWDTWIYFLVSDKQKVMDDADKCYRIKSILIKKNRLELKNGIQMLYTNMLHENLKNMDFRYRMEKARRLADSVTQLKLNKAFRSWYTHVQQRRYPVRLMAACVLTLMASRFSQIVEKSKVTKSFLTWKSQMDRETIMVSNYRNKEVKRSLSDIRTQARQHLLELEVGRLSSSVNLSNSNKQTTESKYHK